MAPKAVQKRSFPWSLKSESTVESRRASKTMTLIHQRKPAETCAKYLQNSQPDAYGKDRKFERRAPRL